MGEGAESDGGAEYLLLVADSRDGWRSGDLHEDIDSLDGFFDLLDGILEIQRTEFDVGAGGNVVDFATFAVEDDEFDFVFGGCLREEFGCGLADVAVDACDADGVDHSGGCCRFFLSGLIDLIEAALC